MEPESLYPLYLQSSGVTTDTRNIKEGNIFFALKGERFNANEFAEKAFEAGASYVVADEISNPEWVTKFGERLIITTDVLVLLQQLSGFHRNLLKCPVLAITGSNGKTTTKELIAAVLSKKYRTYATKGNLNNHIGIPLTLLSIPADAEFAVVEMGANHKKEIASYCQYVKPDYGVITNVGLAHIEGFGGFEGVVQGKTELYTSLLDTGGIVFVSSEQQELNTALAEKHFPSDKIVRYGKDEQDSCVGALLSNSEFLQFSVNGMIFSTNLVGDYNFDNALCAYCIGKYFGVSIADIRSALEEYLPTNNRSQKLTSGSNTIILDAYNANPSSVEKALLNFSKLEGDRKVVILGEMMELGNYSNGEHQKIVEILSTNDWKDVKKIFVGAGYGFLQGDKDVLWFADRHQLKEWFKDQSFTNALILIKGSRKNELEKILD